MSKKHRHRRRYEEELELCPRNNMFPENTPQGAGDPSLMFIGLLEMIGSQFNIFGNNEESNHEDISSNVHAEDEDNVFNKYEGEEEVLNNTTDDTIENDNYTIESDTDIIIEDVEYEVKENTAEDIEDNDVEDICNIEDKEDKYNTDDISYIDSINNESFVDNKNSIDNIDSEYNIHNTNSIKNIENIIENIDDTNNIEKDNIDYIDDTNNIEEDNIDDISNINDIEFTENHVTVHCKAEVSNNTVLECCFSKNIRSKFIKEPVVSKLPVIISEIEIPIYIETMVKFNDSVFKIIDVNKNVFLESCHLINNSNKLFIKGFIRENITYAVANCVTGDSVSGKVKSLEIDIPFKCCTGVYFNTTPLLNNEVCCKMDSTNILETMSQEEFKGIKNTLPETYTFKSLRKKIILNLGISLMQEQYVFVSK